MLPRVAASSPLYDCPDPWFPIRWVRLRRDRGRMGPGGRCRRSSFPPTSPAIAAWPIIRKLLRRPLRTFVVDDQRSYRGIDILVAALHVAEAIAAKSRATQAAIMLPTTGAFPIAALAAWMLGRTVVPLNYLLKPEELVYRR